MTHRVTQRESSRFGLAVLHSFAEIIISYFLQIFERILGESSKVVSFDLRSTDGLTALARIEIVVILVLYQPSYNTSHSDPLLFANVTLGCGMYPAGEVDIS